MKNIQSFQDFLNEGIRRNPDMVNKDSKMRIKTQIERYSELMKTNPEKANFYKAQLDLAHARMVVVDLKQKVDNLRESEDVDFEDEINESIINEESDVSVDKILNAKEKKALKDAFENVVTGIDKLSFKKDGSIVAKRGYFYRHGMTADKVASNLTSQLLSQGIEINVIETYDDWKPWPKDSNLVVVFKVTKV